MTKHFILSILLLFTQGTIGSDLTFIALHKADIVRQEGDIQKQHAPFSTFKIALALFGFEENILTSPETPEWSFQPEFEKRFQDWYAHEIGVKYHWVQNHTPKTFMKNSVVWFSHEITSRLGKVKFQDLVTKLNYGNMDISGTPGKKDGLLNSWLGTSLKISPLEQVNFIALLENENLPGFSKKSQELTKLCLNRDETWGEWQLYGKTGAGNKTGWFVGWIEKRNEKIYFASFLDGSHLTSDSKDTPSGIMAKEQAKEQLKSFWQ